MINSNAQGNITTSAGGKRPAGTKMHSTQSVNELLNFSLPPRQQQPVPRRSRKYGTQHGVWNKERFVNAQYRFVMIPNGDYTVHFADPDIYFQWQDILQVLISRTSALAAAGSNSSGDAGSDEGLTTCPICLSPPVAPRMTKCGHIFCFPCVLHLINTSEKGWVRCPICFDSVNERQLKAIKWHDPPVEEVEEPNGLAPAASSSSSALGIDSIGAPKPGSILSMRLMQRPSITTLALPRSATWPSDLLPPHQAPWHFLPDVQTFSKFMLATPAYLLDALATDLDALAAERRSLVGMKDELGVVFVDAAEAKVRTQMERAAELETPPLRESVERALRDQTELETRMAKVSLNQSQSAEDGSEAIPDAFLAARSGSAGAAPPSVRTPRTRKNVNPPPPSTSTYYYYQASTGLPVFLHPLDIRVLHAHFEAYSSFPDRIFVRVEAATASTVDDGLRRRCKYLAHLPEGADVVFVEADLEGVVGPEGIAAFDGALKSRRARRRDKDRKDNNARARAEERDRERREAELNASRWSGPGAALSHNHHIVVPEFEIPEYDAFPAVDVVPVSVVASPPATTQAHTGPWGGARSFASAAHRAPTAGTQPRNMAPSRRQGPDEDWADFDGAWDDLEQQIATNGGRKKRGSRMVVLGGGGRRR